MDNNKKKTLMIILIVFVIILVSLIIYASVNKKNKTNPNTEDDVADTEYFDTMGSEKLFTLISIEDITTEDKTNSKILVSFNNNTELDLMMSQYFFRYADADHNLVNYCYTASYGPFKEMSDVFPDIAPANKVTQGYIYCLGSSENAKYLTMSYLLHPIIEGSNDDIESVDYDFELGSLKNK